MMDARFGQTLGNADNCVGPNVMITFHINDTARAFDAEIKYVLSLWAKNQSHEIAFSSGSDNAIVVGTDSSAQLRVCPRFPTPGGLSTRSPYVQIDGAPTDRLDDMTDPVASAFQMVNSLQEYDAPDYDELNRYQYKASYQKRLNNVYDNLVQGCFDTLSR